MTIVPICFFALAGLAGPTTRIPTPPEKAASAEFAEVGLASRPSDLAIVLPGGVAFHFSRIPAQVFRRGADPALPEGMADLDEKPAREVELRRDIYVQRTEVTIAQWRAAADFPLLAGCCAERACDPDSPVRGVSWIDANRFAEALGRLAPFRFRLPSEAEWEAAALGGAEGDPFLRIAEDGSPSIDPALVAESAWNGDTAGGRVRPVALKRANPYGLFDMFGNVGEWCLDYYHFDLTEAPPDVEPWVDPPTHGRVRKGGDCSERVDRMRPSARWVGTETHPYRTMGFRLVAEDPFPRRAGGPLVLVVPPSDANESSRHEP